MFVNILKLILFSEEVPEFLLGGNPWVCDCNLEWFKRVNQLAVEGTFPRVLDLDTVLCTAHGAHNNSLQQMTRMRSEDFQCQYDAHCIPECYCCDFLACDCRMQCPDGERTLELLPFIIFFCL